MKSSKSKPKSKSSRLSLVAVTRREPNSLKSADLQITIPSETEALRRSPRFTSPVPLKSLRRSPRLSPVPDTINARSVRLIKSAESLRRSPRFSDSTSSGAQNVEMQDKVLNGRSPRTSARCGGSTYGGAQDVEMQNILLNSGDSAGRRSATNNRKKEKCRNGECLGAEKFLKQSTKIADLEHGRMKSNLIQSPNSNGRITETEHTFLVMPSQLKSKSKSKANTWCLLSLEESQPLPLNVCLPELTTCNESEILRRSPRLNTPIPNKPLRRSNSCSHFSAMKNGTTMTERVSLRRPHSSVDLLNSNCCTNKENRTQQIVNDQCLKGEIISRQSWVTSEAEDEDVDTTSMEMPSIGKRSLRENRTLASSEKKLKKQKVPSYLIGNPVPVEEAEKRWGWRYELKNQKSNPKVHVPDDDDEDKIVTNVECHYTQAQISGCIFNLGDCAYIKGEGGQKHVGKILEFFKTTAGEEYFRVQWFYRAEDTVMQDAVVSHDSRRLFYSTVMNDNPVDCIISKVSITQVPPTISSNTKVVTQSDFYYDMEYRVDYSTFRTLPYDHSSMIHDSSLSSSSEPAPGVASPTSLVNMLSGKVYKEKLVLLDLFSGCGGMSTGLCLGAKSSGIDLFTKWALDIDGPACESLKLNHPEAQVRNEAAEDFLELLKEWKKLCKRHNVNNRAEKHRLSSVASRAATSEANSSEKDDVPPDEFEVAHLNDICYGDPNKTGKRQLHFKVRWKGYSASDDTWEPMEGLRNCQEKIRSFVTNGYISNILPLPGDVDVICGGPPCQGISGYNRFRNVDSPLDDERNRQIIVYMDIVGFLKPKFVLMENVVDILRFDKASLGRYALSRLVHMKYQARLGIIAAGCYGLPQFRLRVFLWGAHPKEKLPQFPLPSHDVIVRYWPPPEFERNTVAYDEDQPRELEKAIVLQDAISDLPAVTSHEAREEMSYEKPPETEFQRFIRSHRSEMIGSAIEEAARMEDTLYDHRPYQLSEDDYIRVCQIPKRKGANFRDLPGVVVGTDNVARRDPTQEQILLPSGKPMVPDYALAYEQGKSKRPFARLWWDENVPTLVTFPNLHCMAVIHPEQDRVLTIRECARLQGFPDYYRFSGTVKQRYCQIGNAVPVFVARTLGYTLGLAVQKLSGDEPLMTLPPKFSYSTNRELANSFIQKTDSHQ